MNLDGAFQDQSEPRGIGVQLASGPLFSPPRLGPIGVELGVLFADSSGESRAGSVITERDVDASEAYLGLRRRFEAGSWALHVSTGASIARVQVDGVTSLPSGGTGSSGGPLVTSGEVTDSQLGVYGQLGLRRVFHSGLTLGIFGRYRTSDDFSFNGEDVDATITTLGFQLGGKL